MGFRFSNRFFACIALLASVTAAGSPIERVISTPTAWVYMYGATVAQLNSVLSENDYRIVDLQVESVNSGAPVLTAVMVANTGDYAKGWWWYVGQTVSQVSASLSTNNARLISIAPYVVNGTTYFASVMVPNTGADAKSWYWWIGTAAQIAQDLSSSGARMVDLEPYVNGPSTSYAAIAIGNTGADADSWWWYLQDSQAGLQTHVGNNGAQLLTFNTEPGTSTFDSVMQGGFDGNLELLPRNQSKLLSALLVENGARLTQLRSDLSSGTRAFNAITIDNSTACTSRIIGIQHGSGTGWNGDYLKQISGAAVAGGPTLCAAADARLFDPSGAIETAIGTYVMNLAQQGAVKLNDKIPVLDPANYCTFQTTGKTETVQSAVSTMLLNSDSARADSLLQHYGISNFTAYAHANGMPNTTFNSYLGCTGTHNTMTLDDAAALYAGLSGHTLLSGGLATKLLGWLPGRTQDSAGMWSDLQSIIAEEAPRSLPQAQLATFIAGVTLSYKSGLSASPGGIADLNGQTEFGDEGIDGVIGIPHCKDTSQEMRHFTFGFFHESTQSDSDQTPLFNAMGAGAEMVREQVHDALITWKKCG